MKKQQQKTKLDAVQERIKNSPIVVKAQNNWFVIVLTIIVSLAIPLIGLCNAGLSVVSLWNKYVIRKVVIPDTKLDQLRGMRFGDEITLPKEWLCFTPENGDGVSISDPDNSAVRITITGSFANDNMQAFCNGDNTETVDQYIERHRSDTSPPLRYHPLKYKVIMLTSVTNGPPVEQMKTGYWWEQNEADGVQDLLFVAKSNGVWHFITCEASTKVYRRYKDLFLETLDSYRIVIDKETDRDSSLDKEEIRSAP